MLNRLSGVNWKTGRHLFYIQFIVFHFNFDSLRKWCNWNRKLLVNVAVAYPPYQCKVLLLVDKTKLVSAIKVLKTFMIVASSLLVPSRNLTWILPRFIVTDWGITFLIAAWLPHSQLWAATVEQTVALTQCWSLCYREPCNESPDEHPVVFEPATLCYLCNMLNHWFTRISMILRGFIFAVVKCLS